MRQGLSCGRSPHLETAYCTSVRLLFAHTPPGFMWFWWRPSPAATRVTTVANAVGELATGAGPLAGGVILLMVISFTALTLALGSPLYDKISESVDREFGEVSELDEPVSRGVLRSVRQSLALIGIAAVVAPLLFIACSVPVIGQTVVPVTSAVFGGWMLGIELLGSPFERRGLLRLGERRAAMRGKRLRVLGFTVPAFLLLAIPFAGVVVFPVATAGGTLLARQLLAEPA